MWINYKVHSIPFPNGEASRMDLPLMGLTVGKMPSVCSCEAVES